MIALLPFQAPPKAENGLAVPPSVTRNMASSFSGGAHIYQGKSWKYAHKYQQNA
jgi:hypothetical protein